jgi:hypothetical protein
MGKPELHKNEKFESLWKKSVAKRGITRVAYFLRRMVTRLMTLK